MDFTLRLIQILWIGCSVLFIGYVAACILLGAIAEFVGRGSVSPDDEIDEIHPDDHYIAWLEATWRHPSSKMSP